MHEDCTLTDEEWFTCHPDAAWRVRRCYERDPGGRYLWAIVPRDPARPPAVLWPRRTLRRLFIIAPHRIFTDDELHRLWEQHQIRELAA